jgi:hypothetical protein
MIARSLSPWAAGMELSPHDRHDDNLQVRFGVKSEEQVTFARLDYGAYRGGIRFSNGKEISLQLLGSGVSVGVVASRASTLERPASREKELALA